LGSAEYIPSTSAKDSWLDYKELFNVLKKSGKTQGDNILYPANFWKNAHMIFRTEIGQKDIEKKYQNNINYFPAVIASDARSVTVEGKWGDNNEFSTYDTLHQILSNKSTKVGFWLDNHWERVWGLFSYVPRCTEWAISEARPRTYYRAYIGNNSFIPPGFKGNSSTLDCDGNPSSYSETEENLLKWDYNDGNPIRSDAQGIINLIVTSSKSCNRVNWANKKVEHNNASERNTTKSVWTHNIFVRPDIVELVNVSDKPVSIAGWRVMVNTGSVAKELSYINSATHYEPASGGYLDDKNPVIPPNGYAYLTSDSKIFDLEYGASKSGTWCSWRPLAASSSTCRTSIRRSSIPKDSARCSSQTCTLCSMTRCLGGFLQDQSPVQLWGCSTLPSRMYPKMKRVRWGDGGGPIHPRG